MSSPDAPLPTFASVLHRMANERAMRPSDANALVLFFRAAAVDAAGVQLATRVLSDEMTGFAAWHASAQHDYVEHMHTHVRNLDDCIARMPASGIGHAFEVAPVGEHDESADVHRQAMRRYWFHVLRPAHQYPSPCEEMVEVDRRALFIADSRLAHERLLVMTTRWTRSATGKQERTVDLSRFLESLPYEDGHVRQDVMASLIRQYPHSVDMLVVYRHTASSFTFRPLLVQWNELVQLDRAAIVDMMQLFPVGDRLGVFICFVNFASRRNRIAHAFLKWPCKEDTEFVAALMRIMRPWDQTHLADALFRSLVPLENFEPPDADEAYFDAYFAPILAAVAPESLERVASVLLCTLNVIPAFMVKRIVGDYDPNGHRGRILRDNVNEHTRFMETMLDRARVTDHRNFTRENLVARHDVPLELDPLTQEPLHPDKACRICFENERIMCVLPCSHIVSCVACFARLVAPKTCPECRTSVRSAHTVFR